MCSSPKSSGTNRRRSMPSKSFAESFTSEQRARFTDVANRAQQRREKRLATDKRWQHAQDQMASEPQKPSLVNWFMQLITSH